MTEAAAVPLESFAVPGLRAVRLRVGPAPLPTIYYEQPVIWIPLAGTFQVSFQWRSASQHFRYRPGIASVVPAFLPHAGSLDGLAGEFLSVTVNGLADSTSGEDGGALRPAFGVRDRELLTAAGLLREHFRAGSPYGEIYAESLALALASHLRRVYGDGRRTLPGGRCSPALSPSRVRHLLDFLEDNLEEALTLTVMAQLVGLSRSHFLAAFRRFFGVPPHHFLIDLRVRRAIYLLTSREPPALAQVAQRCGFADQSHLNFHFRRMLGTTPHRYARDRAGRGNSAVLFFKTVP